MEAALRSGLNTDDGKDPSGQPERWENNTFHNLPLVAVITLLSKIQVDVRNAETEILNYLFDQIDKATFKFDKVSAVVIPKSTYVTLGSNYEASVFLSATDSRQLPPITVDGRQLEYDEEGRGIYTARPSSLGIKKWGGVISLKAPDGTLKPYPFSTEYSVGEPNVIVSPTAVNIMYMGIANPIDVSVPSVRPDKIKIRVTNGTYSTEKVKNSKGEPYRGNWAVTPTVEAGKVVQVIVSAEDANGKLQTYAPYEFRVKNIPKPESQFAGKNSGPISLGVLKATDQVFAVLKDFEFDLTYTVTEFTMAFVDRFGLAERSTTGSRLSPEQKEIISRLTRGQALTFYNIKARAPSGKIEDLGPIVLKVD
jgi:gliding motility-associated protein GldM